MSNSSFSFGSSTETTNTPGEFKFNQEEPGESHDQASAQNVATFRKTIAEQSTATKVKGSACQIKSMGREKVTYNLEQRRGAVQSVSTVPEAQGSIIEDVICGVGSAVGGVIGGLIGGVINAIDSAIGAIGGLLGSILQQTAISEKNNEMRSESMGFSSQVTKVARGLKNKVKKLSSVNDSIRYDNWAHSANRINTKTENLRDLTSTCLSAVKTGVQVIGVANQIMNSVNNGIFEKNISFGSFSGLLPDLNMSSYMPPIPQISCPSLPSFPSIPAGIQMDERSTIQAVKAVRDSINFDMQEAFSDAILALQDQLDDLAPGLMQAIDDIAGAIAEIEEVITEDLIEPITDGIDALTELGNEGLDALGVPSRSQFSNMLDEMGLDDSCRFNFNSSGASKYGYNNINQPLQRTIRNIADTKKYIKSTVYDICDVTPSVHALVGIPNDPIEAARHLGVSEPVTPIESGSIPEPKSTIEPLLVSSDYA